MESPYEYYNKQLGVKMRYLIADKDKHPQSLCVANYRAFNKRLNNPEKCEKQLRKGCFGNDALVLFSSLDHTVKHALVFRFGPAPEVVAKSLFVQSYTPDRKAYVFFIAHTYGEDNKKLDLEYVEQYTYNASVLNSVIEIKANRKQFARAKGVNTLDIWQSLSNDVNAFREVNHKLPTTKDGLRRKTLQYINEGYMALISDKFGMKNALKVKEKEQMALLDELIAKHTNLDNVLIANIYEMVATRMNWPTITSQTVANRKKESHLITYAGRNGVSELKNNLLMQHKRTKPTTPMLYWTLDGWDAELMYQQTTIDKKGYSTTTYHNRLTMVVVLDAFNKYPIGYAIGSHESPELIKEAMRNAINHTQELLGSKYNPRQLQSDNYQIKALKPVYEACTKYFTPAQVKNAKSKVIEPYFNHINKTYCRLMDNWSGYNVDSGSKNQPNDEMLNKLKKFFPDEAGCRSQLEQIIRTERNKKGKEFFENWQNVPEDLKLPMPEENYLLALGKTTGETNKLVGEGLLVTIDGLKRTYDNFDLNFRKQAHQDWTILYDSQNTSQVLAVSKDQKHRFMLEQKHNGAMALDDRKENDAEQYDRINKYNENAIKHIVKERQENGLLIENLFKNPLLNDTLAKHLLVDSRGQHKDQRNRERLKHNGEKVLLKQEKQEQKQVERTWQDEQTEYINKKVNINKYLQHEPNH